MKSTKTAKFIVLEKFPLYGNTKYSCSSVILSDKHMCYKELTSVILCSSTHAIIIKKYIILIYWYDILPPTCYGKLPLLQH